MQLPDCIFYGSSIYACFEESISEYGAQVNQFNIRDNLFFKNGLRLEAAPLDSKGIETASEAICSCAWLFQATLG